VLKRLALILIAVLIGLGGCSRFARRTTDEGEYAQALGTSGGMTAYLLNQGLAELESVEPWQSEYGDGLKLTTTHYEVFTTLFEPLMLRQVPRFMESAYRGYNDQLPEPIETMHKFTV